MKNKQDQVKKKKKDQGAAPEGFRLSRVNEFITEVKGEFGKIVWPTKKQTLMSTGVVIVLVLMLSFYLGAVDLVLGKIVAMVLR